MTAAGFIGELAEYTMCGLIGWSPAGDGIWEAQNGSRRVLLCCGDGDARSLTVEDGGAALCTREGGESVRLLAEAVIELASEPRRLARAGAVGSSVDDLLRLALRLTESGEMHWSPSGPDALRARAFSTGPAFSVLCPGGFPYGDPQWVRVEMGGETFLRRATTAGSAASNLARAAAESYLGGWDARVSRPAPQGRRRPWRPTATSKGGAALDDPSHPARTAPPLASVPIPGCHS